MSPAAKTARAPHPHLTLRTPPRYGRRAVASALAAASLVGLSFCIDQAAANQLGYSSAPATWTLYLSGVALYYAVICTILWIKGRRKERSNLQKDPPCQSAADIL